MLFHGRVGTGSIDQAIEKLSSLQLVTSLYVKGRGRPTTVWSAIDLA
jgi:DNA-binding PadR family transcriptional regulator